MARLYFKFKSFYWTDIDTFFTSRSPIFFTLWNQTNTYQRKMSSTGKKTQFLHIGNGHCRWAWGSRTTLFRTPICFDSVFFVKQFTFNTSPSSPVHDFITEIQFISEFQSCCFYWRTVNHRLQTWSHWSVIKAWDISRRDSCYLNGDH